MVARMVVKSDGGRAINSLAMKTKRIVTSKISSKRGASLKSRYRTLGSRRRPLGFSSKVRRRERPCTTDASLMKSEDSLKPKKPLKITRKIQSISLLKVGSKCLQRSTSSKTPSFTNTKEFSQLAPTKRNLSHVWSQTSRSLLLTSLLIRLARKIVSLALNLLGIWYSNQIKRREISRHLARKEIPSTLIARKATMSPPTASSRSSEIAVRCPLTNSN